MSMPQSVVSAFPCKQLITKRVSTVVPQGAEDKGKLQNRKHRGPREAELPSGQCGSGGTLKVEKTAKSWKRVIPENLFGATAQAGHRHT